MRSPKYVLIFFLMIGVLGGCSSAKKDAALDTGSSIPVAQSAQSGKMKVADVSNNSRQLFDVDAIGMLWNGIDENLRVRGLLWTGPPAASPYTLEAHIIHYQKGSIWLRSVLPMWGKTALVVKCDLKKDGRVIASVESKHAITIGKGSLTFAAWRKVFAEVSQDLVNQLIRMV